MTPGAAYLLGVFVGLASGLAIGQVVGAWLRERACRRRESAVLREAARVQAEQLALFLRCQERQRVAWRECTREALRVQRRADLEAGEN